MVESMNNVCCRLSSSSWLQEISKLNKLILQNLPLSPLRFLASLAVKIYGTADTQTMLFWMAGEISGDLMALWEVNDSSSEIV